MTTPRYVLGTLLVASLGISAAQAATFGHSRIVSAPGQPLHLEIPVTQLTPQEIDSLQAVPAPAQAWRDAGMTPPVALDSMRLVLLDGFRPDAKVIQLRSDQASAQSIVDILLDVRSASGQHRYQVSLLAQVDTHAVQRAGGESAARNPRAIDGRAAAATASGHHDAAGKRIPVRSGDNMFGIAQRNAVEGVSVYQMMIALQRANSHAFIEDNVNLVKAGASLTMPGLDALTALSDREARQVFQQHAQAFARYRQRGAATDAAAVSTLGAADQGGISDTSVSAGGADIAQNVEGGGDRLRLSGGPQPGAADAGSASALAGSAAQSAMGSAVSQGGASDNAGSTAGSGASAGAAGAAPDAQAGGADTHANSLADQVINQLANSGAIMSDATGASGSQSAGQHPDDQAAMQKNMGESQTRILELEDNVRHLNEALQKTGPVAAEAALEGARSVSEAFKEAMGLAEEGAAADSGRQGSGASAGGGPSSPLAGTSGSSTGAGVGAAGGASSVAGGTASENSSVDASIKEEKKVSWLQENMLAVIGGGLALIVLIVVWLLRRASAAKRDMFESDSPITDSMVRDRLADIDLDLDSPQPGRRSS